MTDERFKQIVWNTIFFKEMRGCDEIAWERLRKVVDLACEDEREACAKVCDGQVERWVYYKAVQDCAAAIRARGDK